MLVHVYDYEFGKNSKKCGLVHGEEAELSAEQIVGLLKHCNIMLRTYTVDRSKDKSLPEKAVILCLDSKNFTQR